MRLTRSSPCKVNLLLNILGRRPDGFHELETVFQPVPIHDELSFERVLPPGVQLTCNRPELPADSTNLVHRAATRFFAISGIAEGVRIHLEKRLPLAAGLGGGSANAAVTLLALNELFHAPLDPAQISGMASELGSDVPFFLQDGPALGTGRGERITPLVPFKALGQAWILLVRPGFGVPTAWAYANLRNHPQALQGTPGRAQGLIDRLAQGSLREARDGLYNSLEAPVFLKYPWLQVLQEFLRENGAAATLMSGSGSTTFALAEGQATAERLHERVRAEFGQDPWMACVALS